MKTPNLFDFENARNLSIQQLVDTFVDTPSYWKLFSNKNQIVLGSRGSGKTSLAKMVSHNHLSLYNNSQAKDIINNKSHIGIYIPMSAEWLGGVNNPKRHCEDNQRLFISKLNIKSCTALIDSIKSCLNTYCEDTLVRINKEINVVNSLRPYWFPFENKINNLKQVENYINRIDFEKQLVNAKDYAIGDITKHNIGIEFDVELFTPLKKGIEVLAQHLDFNENTCWLICLDEAEILTSSQQELINSYLRSCSSNMFFKIITMPYAHTTRQTTLGANLNLGDDFEYVYIDNESKFIYNEYSTMTPDIINNLFYKRARLSNLPDNITIDKLLGNSILLDKKAFDRSPDSTDMALLKKYADEKTLNRANSLLSNKKYIAFNNQIGRKMRGLLYLKDNVEKAKGRTKIDVYSGTRMIVRCTDGNPRRLIRLFKLLLEKSKLKNISSNKIPLLSTKEQSDILMKFSESTLSRIQSEEAVGTKLHALLSKIGNIMREKIHDNKLSTEQVYSIEVKDISDENWQMIQRAVDNGLLYPKLLSDNLPYRQGTFRLAYVLCPYFKLLPRQGRCINLNSILNNKYKSKDASKNEPKQLELF